MDVGQEFVVADQVEVVRPHPRESRNDWAKAPHGRPQAKIAPSPTMVGDTLQYETPPVKQMLEITLEFTRFNNADEPYSFEFNTQEYLLRTKDGGVERTTIHWDEEIARDLTVLKRRSAGQQAQVLLRLGEKLRGFLHPIGWSGYERGIIDALHHGQGVKITIRATAAEIYALPWELLRLKSTGQHLGGLPGVTIHYEWPETTTFPCRPKEGRDFRILLAWSAAGGAVPAQEHIAALQEAAGGRAQVFSPDSDVLSHASFGRIADALSSASMSSAPVSVLHLLCHGANDGDGYGLALDSENSAGGTVPLTPSGLQRLLAPHLDDLQMVVLMACESGDTDASSAQLGSMAQVVHRIGVRAVVASRYPLSVAGSVRIARTMYGALIRDGASLEEAIQDARRDLMRDQERLDWASLQLYQREADEPLRLNERPERPSAVGNPVSNETPRGSDTRPPEKMEHKSNDESPSGTPISRDGRQRTMLKELFTGLTVAIVGGVVVWYLLPHDPPEPRRTSASSASIAGRYSSNGEGGEIYVRALTDNSYEVIKPTCPWAWKGRIETRGSEILGKATFYQGKSTMNLSGEITTEKILSITYEYVTGADGELSSTKHKHTWTHIGAVAGIPDIKRCD